MALLNVAEQIDVFKPGGSTDAWLLTVQNAIGDIAALTFRCPLGYSC